MVTLNAPSVRELLDTAVEKYGDKTFIKFVRDNKIEERSYRKVQSDSKAVCRWIRHFSKESIHIAIIGKTNYEYITCLTGILISGNVAVPFAPDISVDEATEIFERGDISMVLYEEDFADKAKEIAVRCPFIKEMICLGDNSFFEDIYKKYSDDSEYASLSDIEVNKDDCAIIIFTSGTTGVRKGVMLSTRALVSNIMYKEIVFDDSYITLSVLPMYHIFCFSGDYLKNLMDGMGICLNENLRNIGTNLPLFEPNIMRIVPMIAKSLLQKVKLLASKNNISEREASKLVFGSNMKWIYSGGAYLSPELADAYDNFGIYLRQGYGMTEAGCRVSVPDENTDKASVGRVINIIDVRISNGEIQLKTPSLMMGYYKMPEETAKAFTEDGWLRTGDIGYVTEDRQLFITGRVKNIIILSSGENVSPEAIEKKFNAYPLVSEVLVYGKNDRLVAEIYPDESYVESNEIKDVEKELEKITDELNANAKASHVIAELIVRKDPLEKTATGKIKRKDSNV